MKPIVLAFALILATASQLTAQTWVKKVSGSGLGNSLTYNPLNLNTVYGSPNSQTLWVSYDRGDTWQQLSTLSGGSGITAVAVSVIDTNIILVGQKGSAGNDRVMRSTNHGLTWTQTWTGTFSYYGVPIETKPQHPDTVLVMSGTTIYRSTDFGLTWNTLTTTAGFNVWCDAELNPASANIVLIGDNTAGIWKSTDGGVTWAQKHTTTGEIPMLAWDPFKPNVAYATKWGGGGGFVKSTDYGETWYSVPEFTGQNMWSLACAVAVPSFTMTCSYTGQNMRFSFDDGTTWVLRNAGLGGAGYGALALDTVTIFALQGDGIYKYVHGPPVIPPVPSLAAPANGSTNQLAELTLSWNASSGATLYHVQIATDSLFINRILDDSTISGTTRDVGPLQDTTRYFWRVRAKNISGSSAFSAHWNFRTGSTGETRTDLIPDGGGYMFSASHSTLAPRPSYRWIQAGPGMGTFVPGSNSDDFLTAPLNLPWPFYFNGTNFTQIRISTNGWMTFNIADTLPAYTESEIPGAGLPEYVIAALWDDLRNHPSITGSGIYTYATGSTFVIAWYAMRRYDTGGDLDTLTFQIALDASDSTVSIAYARPVDGGFVYGASATQSATGIEGDGSAGIGSGYYFQGDKPLNKPTAGTLVKFSRSASTLGSITLPSFSGVVRNDLDADLQTAGDRSPLPGLNIRLLQNGSQVASVATNGSGEFSFTGLNPGTYDVFNDNSDAWIPIGAIPGSGGTITAISPSQFTITLVMNDSATGNEFVLVNPSHISGAIYQDFDGDTLTMADRLPFENLLVFLSRPPHPPLDTLLSDTAGAFHSGPLAGGNVLLQSDTAGGWRSILSNPGSGAHSSAQVDDRTLGLILWSGDTVSGIYFVLHQPGLKIISPNGGEQWKGGTYHDIRWARPSGMRITLEYSTNAGGNWIPIAANLPDTVLAFRWMVPFSQTASALVRITTPDSAGYSDMSDAVFAIESTSQHTVAAGWNLLSLPCDVPDHAISALYPEADSRAFLYRSGYFAADSVTTGEGFWLKFGAPGTVTIIGTPVLNDTIDIAERWNIVGSVSVPIPAGQTITVPTGIISSPFYEFDGKYRFADTLRPGKGYWIKASQPGQLLVGAASPIRDPMLSPSSMLTKEFPSVLTIADAGGTTQELRFGIAGRSAGDIHTHELPPLPPSGTPDIRFAPMRETDAGYDMILLGEGTEHGIALQSLKYPLSCSFEYGGVHAMSGELTVRKDGKLVSVLSGPGKLSITDPSMVLALRSGMDGGAGRPAVFALAQNHPNPFNPTTVIRYSLPVDGYAALRLYDVLGREVVRLVDGNRRAGDHEVVLDAGGLAGGIYFYELTAGTTRAVKKMMLVK